MRVKANMDGDGLEAVVGQDELAQPCLCWQTVTLQLRQPVPREVQGLQPLQLPQDAPRSSGHHPWLQVGRGERQVPQRRQVIENGVADVVAVVAAKVKGFQMVQAEEGGEAVRHGPVGNVQRPQALSVAEVNPQRRGVEITRY